MGNAGVMGMKDMVPNAGRENRSDSKNQRLKLIVVDVEALP